MADIKKHQAKIAELRQNHSHLTQDSIDAVRNEQSLHVAVLIRGLSEKLAAQVCKCHQPVLCGLNLEIMNHEIFICRKYPRNSMSSTTSEGHHR